MLFVESPEPEKAGGFINCPFVLPAAKGIAGRCRSMLWAEAERDHSLAISLGEMISVSRRPVFAAVPFNVGRRINFATNLQALTPTPLILRSCGSTASGAGKFPLHTPSPSPTFRFLIRRHNRFPLLRDGSFSRRSAGVLKKLWLRHFPYAQSCLFRFSDRS